MTTRNGYELTLAPDASQAEALSPFAEGAVRSESVPLAHESAEQGTVRQAIAAGTTDVNALTNLVFFARHPERNSRALSSSEPGFAALGAEWTAIRDTVVRPLLPAAPTAPAAGGELWVPGAERLANPRSAGGSYENAPWRFVFHTIEGEPSEKAFRSMVASHTNPPHLWAMPSANVLLQTISLHRSGYALARPGSVQTNRLHAVQVEVHGYAAKMESASAEMLRWLAERVLAPVARMVPLDLTQVTPRGPGEPCFGVNSPCRMTPEKWATFNGVCGHRDVPTNEHWDPGRLDLAAIAARAREVVGASGASYIQREQFESPHDGPSFVAERDDEEPSSSRWLEIPAAPWIAQPPPAGQEGPAEQDEVQAFLERQAPDGNPGCDFPSGVRLRVVAGPTAPGEDHWDPNGSGEPLYDTSASQQSLALATNFVVGELCSSGGRPSDLARISCRLVRDLQKIRDHVGQPVSVTSGYRSYRANVELYEKRGQKPTNSQHTSGRAADISTSGMSGLEIAKLAITLCGPSIGVGVGTTYAHIDVRGEWARWTYLSDPAESARVIAGLDAHRQTVLAGRTTR